MTTNATTTATPPAPAADKGAAGGGDSAAGGGVQTSAQGAGTEQGGTLLGGAASTDTKGTSSGEQKVDAAPPAELELKLPEGVKADDPMLTGFRSVAKELGLDSPKAQKVADLYFTARQAEAAAHTQRLEEQSKAWQAEVKKDFGEQYEQKLKLARRAADKFVDRDTRAFLNASGLGDHPGLLRMLAKVGEGIAEDSVSGTASETKATPLNNDQAFLAEMYPTMRVTR